jgi:phospholipid/cholesterol/gamma-HCH transport system substrate-binding protein
MRDIRSRTFREGSVGLLLFVGVGLFSALVLWLNRAVPGQRTYKVIVEFANAGGMQKGGAVRFRGVQVGTITNIRPSANGVDVEVEIAQPNLIIPRNVVVEANQTGLISQSIVEIMPQQQIAAGTTTGNPLSADCNANLIVCNGTRLKGVIGISLDELIRSSNRFAALYAQPDFYANINQTLKSTSVAAQGVAQLTRELSVLSRSTQKQLGTFSATATSLQRAADSVSTSTGQFTANANQLTTNANQRLNQLSTSANQLATNANQLTTNANQRLNKLSDSSAQAIDKFGATADQFRVTANQVNQLVGNLNELVTTNRSTLVGALNSISQTSEQLRTTVGSLSPSLNRLTQGQLIQNLETLSANAAQASTNLRDVTTALNNPNNLLVLQQTLDSARATFENAQKITSELDELTGDPTFRENLRQLVNGLSNLVSSTQQMQQQVQVAETLDSVQTAINNPQFVTPSGDTNNPVLVLKPSSTTFKKALHQPHTWKSGEDLLRHLSKYRETRDKGLGTGGWVMEASEQGTGNREQEAGSRKQGAESREQGVGSREQGDKGDKGDKGTPGFSLSPRVLTND